MAIANRLDLHVQDGGAGEGRLAFALTDGPGDSATSLGMDMSVIFEFRLPTDAGRGEGYWAGRWHQLGSHPAFDANYLTDFEGVVSEFAVAANIGQVRTNERVFDWFWVQRQFQLNPGKLVVAATQDTPDESLNGSAALTSFVQQNATQVTNATAELPATMMGGEAVGFDAWVVPNVSEDLRKAFASQTCNGCHMTEQPQIDLAFHISPHRSGISRLSPFLNNPTDPSSDELARRTASMQASLCVTP